jgi:hypothetical protein
LPLCRVHKQGGRAAEMAGLARTRLERVSPSSHPLKIEVRERERERERDLPVWRARNIGGALILLLEGFHIVF